MYIIHGEADISHDLRIQKIKTLCQKCALFSLEISASPQKKSIFYLSICNALKGTLQSR